MKKHRKQRTDGIKKAAAPPEKSQTSESPHQYSWKTVAFWIGLTVILVGLKTWAEKHTDAGRYVTEATYNWLQFKIAPKEQTASNIVVVDMSEVPLTGSPPHTDRKKLLELLDAVLVHRPKVVGLDVDFSPAPCADGDPACDSKADRRFLFPAEDPAFLEFCWRNRGRTETGRIVVGITSSVVKGETRWLGNPRYADLAAFIERPNGSESFFANPEMDLWVAGPDTQPADGKQWKCLSLSAAVAVKAEKHDNRRPFLHWPQWAIDEPEIQEEGEYKQLRSQQFLVDFSPIEEFVRNSIRGVDADYLRKDDRLSGKIVLFGRGLRAAQSDVGSPASDLFTVPGQARQAYPGVFLHACAAYTLLADASATLQRLSSWGGIALDVGLSGLIFLLIWILTIVYRRSQWTIAHERLEMLFAWIAAIMVFVFGDWMVNVTHVMWDDFLIVMVLLLLHSAVSTKLPKLWHRIAFESMGQNGAHK